MSANAEVKYPCGGHRRELCLFASISRSCITSLSLHAINLHHHFPKDGLVCLYPITILNRYPMVWYRAATA